MIIAPAKKPQIKRSDNKIKEAAVYILSFDFKIYTEKVFESKMSYQKKTYCKKPPNTPPTPNQTF